MIQFLSSLSDQLEGIKGADNKLRKLIWFHCKYFTANREYTNVLLLECRANARFYSSKAYKLIKDYSKIIIGLIEEGMSEGLFYDVKSPNLVRDMVMGTMDHAALSWVFREYQSPLARADSIADLILRSLNFKKSIETVLDSKTERKRVIVQSATKIFAEKGYDGATISEIAKEAKVADGTIYEYYRNKEDLFLNIPEENLLELLSYIDGASPEKKLERAILFCFRFLNNNRYFTSILVLMLRPNRKFYQSRGNTILQEIEQKIGDIILEGREQGIFSSDFEITVFQDLVFGTIDHIIIPWVIFKRKYNLLQIGEEASRLFVNAILA